MENLGETGLTSVGKQIHIGRSGRVALGQSLLQVLVHGCTEPAVAEELLFRMTHALIYGFFTKPPPPAVTHIGEALMRFVDQPPVVEIALADALGDVHLDALSVMVVVEGDWQRAAKVRIEIRVHLGQVDDGWNGRGWRRGKRAGGMKLQKIERFAWAFSVGRHKFPAGRIELTCCPSSSRHKENVMNISWLGNARYFLYI